MLALCLCLCLLLLLSCSYVCCSLLDDDGAALKVQPVVLAPPLSSSRANHADPVKEMRRKRAIDVSVAEGNQERRMHAFGGLVHLLA